MEHSQAANQHAESKSSDSCREGPSDLKMKGKTVDVRNWGVAGIPFAELDPDTQERELNRYFSNHSTVSSAPRGFSADEQHNMLAYWKAHKTAKKVTEMSATHNTAEPLSSTRVCTQITPAVPDNEHGALSRRMEELQHKLDVLRA